MAGRPMHSTLCTCGGASLPTAATKGRAIPLVSSQKVRKRGRRLTSAQQHLRPFSLFGYQTGGSCKAAKPPLVSSTDVQGRGGCVALPMSSAFQSGKEHHFKTYTGDQYPAANIQVPSLWPMAGNLKILGTQILICHKRSRLDSKWHRELP